MSDGETPDRLSLRAVTEWDGGMSWIADPDEDAQRASHALLTDSYWWL